ncbi:hypothetical protein [Thioclava sp. JM3]|uniref:hypothetical protein n=1 Tax=Thioclava sp. JM3 TaxID=1973004 RepID=UPI0011812B2D|nr:hypothetical protein [Thioclava sp. JM3]
MTVKNTGAERLLRALTKFDDGEVPTNAKGQIDYKNLTLRLRELTADDGEWQVRVDDRQNFYREELKTAVDILAENHRLSQRSEVDIDQVAKSRIAATAKRAKADREGAVHARAQYAALLQKLNEVEAKYAALQRENEGLKAQLDMVRSGLLPKVI